MVEVVAIKTEIGTRRTLPPCRLTMAEETEGEQMMQLFFWIARKASPPPADTNYPGIPVHVPPPVSPAHISPASHPPCPEQDVDQVRNQPRTPSLYAHSPLFQEEEHATHTLTVESPNVSWTLTPLPFVPEYELHSLMLE